MRRHVALGERVLPECAAKRALLERCRALQIAVDRRAIVAAVDWRDDDDDYHDDDDDDDPTNDDALAANPGLEPSSDANVARLAAGGGGPRDPEEEPGRLSRWTRSIPPPADVVAALPPTLDAEIVGDCARPAGGPGKVAPWWFADAVVVIARAGEGFGDDENGDDENGDDEGTIFRGRRGEENETEEENGGVPAAETPPQRGVPAGTQHPEVRPEVSVPEVSVPGVSVPEVSVPGVSVPEVIADLPVPASRILALRRAASQMAADRLPGVFVLLEAKKKKGPRTSKSANHARDEADDPSGEDGAKKCASSSKSGGESGGESGGVSSAFDVASWFSSSSAAAAASASAAPPPSSPDHHPADPDAVARLIARRAGLGPSSRVLVSAATGCSVLNDSGHGASARLAAWREGASEWYRAWAFRRAARYAAAFAADRDCVRFWAAMAPGGAEPGGAVAEGGAFAEGGAVLSRKSAVSSDSERKSSEGDASSKAAAAADSTTEPPNVDASASSSASSSSASSSSASAAASSIASAAHDARLAASLVSLGSFLRTAVEGIRSVGFAGAEELAERHSGTLSRHSKNANTNEKSHPVNPEDERQRLTNALYRAGALEYAAGFVLSWAVPGPLAAHAAHFTNRFRMALCCASLAGESVLAPATVATAVAVAAGGDGKAVRDGFKRRDYWMSGGADNGFVARPPTGSAARDPSEEEEEEEVSISHASSSVSVTSSKEEAEEASSSSVSSVSSSKPPSAPQSAFGGSVGAAFRVLAANGEKLRAKAARAARAAVEGVTGAADDAARLADEDARAEAAEARRRAARIVREIREEGLFLEGNYISGGDYSEEERAAHDEHKRKRERELESSSLELDLGLDADRLARLAWVRHRSSSLAARLSMVVCGPVWLAATQADVTSVVAGAMSARVAEASVATFLPSLIAEEWAARARRRRREAARLTSEEGFVAVRVETIPWGGGGGGGASELERERERERSEDRDEVDEAMRDLATRARVILTVEAYPTPLHKRVAEGTKRGFEEATKVTTDAVMGATKATTDAVKEATKVTTDAVQNATKVTTDAVQNATKATTDAVQNATKATTDAFHTASTSVTHSFTATARWVDAVARAAAAGAAAGAARASETMTTAFDSSSDDKRAARARLLARRLRAAPDGFVDEAFEGASEHSDAAFSSRSKRNDEDSRLVRLAYGRKIASAFADPETRAAVSRPGLAMRLMTDARIARSLRDVPEAAAAFAALTNGDAEAFVAALEKDAGVAALARRALEVVVEAADPAAVEAATKHGLLIPETEDNAEDAECAERAECADAECAGKENDEPGGAAVEDGDSSWSFESLFKGATATEGASRR